MQSRGKRIGAKCLNRIQREIVAGLVPSAGSFFRMSAGAVMTWHPTMSTSTTLKKLRPPSPNSRIVPPLEARFGKTRPSALSSGET